MASPSQSPIDQAIAVQSVWQLKPWWCQPWSIVLTGMGVMGGSWMVFHRIWLTGLVSVPMLIWMGFFVILYPRFWASQSLGSPSDSP